MLAILIAIFSSALAFADSGQTEICKAKSLKEFVQCLKNEHPENKRANLLL